MSFLYLENKTILIINNAIITMKIVALENTGKIDETSQTTYDIIKIDKTLDSA